MLCNLTSGSHRNRLGAFCAIILFFLLFNLDASAQLVSNNRLGTYAPVSTTSNDMVVYPRNVAQGAPAMISYTVLSGFENRVYIVVTDMSGTVWINDQVIVPAGRFNYSFSTAGFVPGLFNVNVTLDGVTTTRVVKVR